MNSSTSIAPESRSISRPLRVLLAAGVQAPSGDNTQPWRFLVDSASGAIAVEVDEGRDPSPMNAGQRMARIAAGAAVENMLRTARFNCWPVSLREDSDGDCTVIQVQHGADEHGSVDPTILARMTNRTCYDARPLPPRALAQLIAATEHQHGIRVHWIDDRTRVTALAKLMGRADALMLGQQTIRRTFLANVKFDSPVLEGLSLQSLALSRIEGLFLRLLPYCSDRFLKWTGGLRALAGKTRRLVASATGVCMISTENRARSADWQVGRTAQLAWLALTDQGLAAQPMMSMPVLANILDHGLEGTLGRPDIAALLTDFHALVPEMEQPAFLFRFGYATRPAVRTGRLPIEELCTCMS